MRLGADGPADKNKTTTFLWWTWTMPKSRTTETFSWWTSAPASAGRGALARARSAGHFSDSAISSTGLGLRRTRPPGPPVGGQERFFGERGTALNLMPLSRLGCPLSLKTPNKGNPGLNATGE